MLLLLLLLLFLLLSEKKTKIREIQRDCRLQLSFLHITFGFCEQTTMGGRISFVLQREIEVLEFKVMRQSKVLVCCCSS
jgi:hypothetical protein